MGLVQVELAQRAPINKSNGGKIGAWQEWSWDQMHSNNEYKFLLIHKQIYL